MIQRIQSIWLSMAFVAGILLFFLPLTGINSAGAEFILKYRGVYKITQTGFTLNSMQYSLAIMSLIVTVLSVVNIFLYKNRNLQMRICVLNIILVFSLIGLIVYASYFTFVQEEVSHTTGSILPLTIIVFTFLARRSIKKDEDLVKSTYRLR